MNNKYKANRITNIAYSSLIIIAALLVIIRWVSVFDSQFLVFNQEVNSHINNFSLSLLFYLCVGFSWVLQGVSFKKIILLGILIVLGNILCESVMGFMNTTDPIDAIYGICVTTITFCFLLITNKYGLQIIDK
ncbi:MAG: hypothetical protein RR512_06180 [Coprobacillus sp.]